MKRKTKAGHNIIEKAKKQTPIRVLYKKVDKPPEVKIIDNVFKLKKAIIENHLEIIPYEKLLLIYNCQDAIPNEKTNIVLTFRSIKGDCILVDFDKNKREFKGLSQEDVIWYTKDLMNKSPVCNSTNKTAYKQKIKRLPEYHERNFEREDTSQSTSFEKSIISVLTNIELVLTGLLQNKSNGGTNHE